MYSEQPTAGNAYTEDAEYYGFVGAPREVIIYDWTIRRYRKAVMQPLSVSADRVVAPRVEPVEVGGHYTDGYGLASDKCRELMTRHGPMTVYGLMKAIGLTRTGIESCLRRNGHLFCMVGKRRWKQSGLWGLVGVHDKGAA